MRYLLIGLLSLMLRQSHAQQDFYEQELLNLGDLSRLPQYRTGDMDQLSSYDRTGGNDDGFSGKYSYVRKEAGGLVMADLKGPGVVNRIWTPTPTTDTVKFFFDGESHPRIAVPFIDLFSGKVFPFLAPLSGYQIGGYYCYLPIPYERSLKIVYAGKDLRFHQTQYRTVRKQENVRSFTPDLYRAHQSTIDQVAAVWNKTQSPLEAYGSRLKLRKINLTIKPGEEQSLFTSTTGGRVAGIVLNAAGLEQAYGTLALTARWDDDTKNAVAVPLHDLFGYAFSKPSMQSIILGSGGNQLYCYLPMPFDRSATIRVKHTGKSQDEELTLTGVVYYTDDKRDPAREGRLYAQSRREYNIPSGSPHVIADVRGRGHFVGTLLMSQGLEEGHTRFFEGDDRAVIDGKLRLHGTGSEDYFNGGWYAVMDRWDRGISLPIHGSLTYSQMRARTGGYRFYLNDKLSFNNSFQLTIEHQPEAPNNVKTDYISTGFFYADKPQFDNASLTLDNSIRKITHRDKLTPQEMVFSLYWLAQASFEDPAIVFTMRRSDKWYATIDAGSVPMAQLQLNGLDKGRYKLFIECEKSEGRFSIWQRSKQVSDWINGSANQTRIIPAGEIEITDEVTTITLRKDEGDATVSILSVLFEKIE